MCAAQQEPSFGETLLSSELELALHEILWRKKGFLLNVTEHLPKPRCRPYAGGAGGGVAIKQTESWSGQYTCHFRAGSAPRKSQHSELHPLPAGPLGSAAGTAVSARPGWEAHSTFRKMPHTSEAASAPPGVQRQARPRFQVRAVKRQAPFF